MLSSTF